METTASGAATVSPSGAGIEASFVVARRTEEISGGLLRRKAVVRWHPLRLARVAAGASPRHFVLTPLPAAAVVDAAGISASASMAANKEFSGGPKPGEPWVCLSAHAQPHPDHAQMAAEATWRDSAKVRVDWCSLAAWAAAKRFGSHRHRDALTLCPPPDCNRP